MEIWCEGRWNTAVMCDYYWFLKRGNDREQKKKMIISWVHISNLFVFLDDKLRSVDVKLNKVDIYGYTNLKYHYLYTSEHQIWFYKCNEEAFLDTTSFSRFVFECVLCSICSICNTEKKFLSSNFIDNLEVPT